jgi:CubicO group peptidase (beta-lactamase class C family)
VTSTILDSRRLQQLVDRLAFNHGVPGAVVGVSIGDLRVVVATGVARLGGNVAVTPETVFLIASVTKVWTATLVLQLADEGLIDLDSPVNRYLAPQLRLRDQHAADSVTVAQLLCHSGGFLGDPAEPDFRDDDAVERLLEGYAELEQVHTPGTLFSYSNSGYNVLGRLVECVTGMTWDEALRTRLIDPLGLEHTSTLPEETMTRPLAVGHRTMGPGSLELTPVSRWLDPRSTGPCGSTLATTAGDLLDFVQHHLADGMAPSGLRLMSEDAAQAMRVPRIVQPDPSRGPAWGWGWEVVSESPLVVGHIGSASGQQSKVVAAPDRSLVIAVLTNGDAQGLFGEQVVGALLEELAGLALPTVPDAAGTVVDTTGFVGRYWFSHDATITVRHGSEGLEASFDTRGPWADFHGDFTAPLIYAGGSTFNVTMPPLTTPVTVTFVREDGQPGPATHLSTQMRMARRLD